VKSLRPARWLLSLLLLVAPTAQLGAQAPTFTVSVLVFYDENANGVLDAGEDVRLPNVEVVGVGGAARTSSSGVATLSLPSGEQRLSLVQASLPTYYSAAAAATLTVPQQSQVLLPVTLPLAAGRRPNTYMAFGDSITLGDGSRNREGYRAMLQADLRAHFGRADILNEGIDGTMTRAGIERLEEALPRQRPAFTLIHYGTNDWNAVDCKGPVTPPCFTVASLRAMVRLVKAQGSLPVVATIIPTNIGYDQRTPEERNDWVRDVNLWIRAMAAEEGCVLADTWQAFVNAGVDARLFSDHVHPNDAGYRLMADAFFEALTKPRPQP
jgi:lysophospholipase L1-like esterase